MENNYKKGFSLAEMLIVFLLISIMLSVFAPVMTKSSKRRYDPNCPTGIKTLIVEYTEPGEHSFIAPDKISPAEYNAIVTLIGAGGAGGNGVCNDDMSRCGGGPGGGGGAYVSFKTRLEPGGEYGIDVGAGGINDGVSDPNGSSSAFSGNTQGTVIAGGGQFGADASLHGDGSIDDSHGGYSGKTNVNNVESDSVSFASGTGSSVMKTKLGFYEGDDAEKANNEHGGLGGGNSRIYGVNAPKTPGGKICDENCNPNGRPGSSYAANGLSELGFVAGMGGGGGGYSQVRAGSGGRGGDGYVRIEYQLRCD